MADQPDEFKLRNFASPTGGVGSTISNTPCLTTGLKNTEHEFPLPPVFTPAPNLQGHGLSWSLDDGDQDPQLIDTTPDHGPSPGTSEAELTVLSSREYSVRASDPNDFASVWESMIPALSTLLGDCCKGFFAINVLSFPERSSEAVPRVIYITSEDSMGSVAEHEIGSKIGRAIPPKFNPIYLKFAQGSVEKSGWWGKEQGEKDSICEPRNITYRDSPVIGMSIGPLGVRDAATLGGFIEIGPNLYALSAYHPFEDGRASGENRVSHPAGPDLEINRFQDPAAKSYTIGAVSKFAPPGKLRPSLTFRGMGIEARYSKVELDYCAIGPVPEGKNVVAIPAFSMAQNVTVEAETDVRGNTEVYCLARTSGYSLAFTSDVPGLQRIDGELRREWTVRQYSPTTCSGGNRSPDHWQTTKQWVTSGMGVPGDSGAWLMRRSDNAVMGLIWGRNYDYGSLTKRVRLTYFTPIVDVIADIRHNDTTKEGVGIPSYSVESFPQGGEPQRRQAAVQLEVDGNPWSVYTSNSMGRRLEDRARVIQHSFGSGVTPRYGSVVDRRSHLMHHDLPSAQNIGHLERTTEGSDDNMSPPESAQESEVHKNGSISTWRSRDRLLLGMNHQQSPSMPGLSRSSSVNSFSNSQAGSSDFDNRSASDTVQILGENIDEDTVDVIELIRSKAVFGDANPGQLGLIQAPTKQLLAF